MMRNCEHAGYPLSSISLLGAGEKSQRPPEAQAPAGFTGSLRIRQLYLFFILVSGIAYGQSRRPLPPDQIYAELFSDVQMARIFPDNKTFVDCIPKRSPVAILADYRAIKTNPAIRFSLKRFVEENFTLPVNPTDSFRSDTLKDVRTHIRALWTVLKRDADRTVTGNSLLPLPRAYIVPGGRFREIYYWDSYFTMLGLQESGEWGLIQNMIDNFAYLIDTYGHIPNGNRTYYLSRSQPPFFALMVQLLAQKNGPKTYAAYRAALQKEYDYWMDRTAPTRHVVRMPDGSLLNRYYDQSATPRQESYYEDATLGQSVRDRAAIYRHLRSGAESGWDFSSRWLADGQTLATIRTTDVVPVDLNGLLYQLELTLARAYELSGQKAKAQPLRALAERRKAAIDRYCWDEAAGWYSDYVLTEKKVSGERTLAGMTPFFMGLAPAERMAPAADVLRRDFLKPGGLVTTLKTTGQQWDAPNGWAPLQWMAIQGLENYKQSELAADIARRWAALNVNVYRRTGKLMEKYNVVDTKLEAGGGEYPSQDGFGWTNGVLLKILTVYDL